MKKTYLCLLASVILIASGCSNIAAVAQGISADDFKPKDAGGSDTVPDKFGTETVGNREVLIAATMQDAVNAAADKVEKASVTQPATCLSLLSEM